MTEPITDADLHIVWTHGWGCGEEAERAKIVAWLRGWDNLTALAIANDIENGEHLT